MLLLLWSEKASGHVPGTALLGTFLEQACSGTRGRNRSISRNISGTNPEHFRNMRVRIGVPFRTPNKAFYMRLTLVITFEIY